MVSIDCYLEMYKGLGVEEAFQSDGYEIESSRENYVVISRKERWLHRLTNREAASERLASELRLITGIGLKVAGRLRSSGYHNLSTLLKHPRYSGRARSVQDMFSSVAWEDLVSRTAKRLGRSNPLYSLCASLVSEEDLLGIDIETLGLSAWRDSIFLIGVTSVCGDNTVTKQFFAKNLEGEKEIIKEFLRWSASKKGFVTFNGGNFDIPFIAERGHALLRAEPSSFTLLKRMGEIPNFDVLNLSRGSWNGLLQNHRLKTLEASLLGFEREDDIQSSQVPEYYLTYLASGNAGPLIPVVRHNLTDIISTFGILALIQQSALP